MEVSKRDLLVTNSYRIQNIGMRACQCTEAFSKLDASSADPRHITAVTRKYARSTVVHNIVTAANITDNDMRYLWTSRYHSSTGVLWAPRLVVNHYHHYNNIVLYTVVVSTKLYRQLFFCSSLVQYTIIIVIITQIHGRVWLSVSVVVVVCSRRKSTISYSANKIIVIHISMTQ